MNGGTSLSEYYDTIVIGGGASGMTAAVKAAEDGKRTLLIEKGDRLGRKVSASGNGRCNMMNSGSLKYYGDTDFAISVINNCGIDELTSFFRRYGLIIKELDNGRIYPVTLQSATVVNTFKNALKINHADVLLKTETDGIRNSGNRFICKTGGGCEYTTGKLIICTGGAAQARLGGSSDGYGYLQLFGHHLKQVFPSLVPVVTDQKSISGLSGLRVRCIVSLYDNKRILHREEGEVLFTDYGLSGICIMQCSRFIVKNGLHFELDLMSLIFSDPEEAMNELRARRRSFSDIPPVILLEGILLSKLAYAVLKQAGIPLRGETAGSLSNEQLALIAHAAYHYRVDIIGTRQLEDAQVTAGGIDCEEFDPYTMESRFVKGLYAAGEVLNVDGDCGGFNLMFAFSSGMIAGGFRKGGQIHSEEKQ